MKKGKLAMVPPDASRCWAFEQDTTLQALGEGAFDELLRHYGR